jgi:hypothetical protein
MVLVRCNCVIAHKLVALPPEASRCFARALDDSSAKAPVFLTPELLTSALRDPQLFEAVREHTPDLAAQVPVLLSFLVPSPIHAVARLLGVPLALTLAGQFRRFGTEGALAVCETPEEHDLMASCPHLVAHASVTSALQDTDTRESLTLLRLSPHVLARHFLKELLPAAYQGQTAVSRLEEKRDLCPSEAWLGQFWGFCAAGFRSKPKSRAPTLQALQDWPLLPTYSGKLLAVKAARIVFPASTASDNGAKLAPKDSLSHLLDKVGCEVLAAGEAARHIAVVLEGTLLTLTATSVIGALISEDTNLARLTRPENCKLLLRIAGLVGAGKLSLQANVALRKLPLFPPANKGAPLVDLQHKPCVWFADADAPLPNFVSQHPAEFLARPAPGLFQLYATIQLEEVNSRLKSVV